MKDWLNMQKVAEIVKYSMHKLEKSDKEVSIGIH